MRIGSLFSGIGGLELGLERGLAAAGIAAEVVYQVERSAFCRHILARHWPLATRFDDVCTVGSAVLPPVDLLCGGFPCQDVSSAGRGAGLDGSRSGLWWEFARIIEETRPRWVVVENVASGARRWLPAVRRALGARGYDSLPVGIAACEVGARHRRERVFVVAHVDGQGQLQPSRSLEQVGRWARDGAAADIDRESLRLESGRVSGPHGACATEPGGVAADFAGHGRDEGGEGPGDIVPGANGPPLVSPGWGLPPRPWMVRGVHGLPGGVDGPWKRAGWTPARVRVARIEALGNCVIPAQVEPIGRLIGALEAA